MLLISVQPGEEVMESISRQLAERGARDGAIASLIGAVDASTRIRPVSETGRRWVAPVVA